MPCGLLDGMGSWMGGLLSGKRILVGLLLTYVLSVVYWTVGESFLVFLLFLGVFVGGYFIFVMYRREVAKSERVSFLNLKVKQLGGTPLDDVGSLMLDSTYTDLVTSLERSILDILARGDGRGRFLLWCQTGRHGANLD